MVSALIASNVLLWLAVVVLSALVLVLMRQIGVLHERVTPAGALLGREGPRPGEPAPVLEVEDWSGRVLRIGGSEGGMGTLLFFVSASCPVCKVLLPIVPAVCAAEAPGLRVVIASDGGREEHAAWVREQGLDRSHFVLSAQLGLAFQVGRLPYAVLLDADGTVRARGLVNTREHLESLFEARRRHVASVQEYVSRSPDDDRRVA